MNILELLGSEVETVTYAANEAIFREGEEGHTMYAVREGSVRLSLATRTLERVGPGGFFGEIAVVDAGPRSATATALADCTLVPVSAERFAQLVRQSPEFALEIMRTMAKRLRSMDSRI